MIAALWAPRTLHKSTRRWGDLDADQRSVPYHQVIHIDRALRSIRESVQNGQFLIRSDEQFQPKQKGGRGSKSCGVNCPLLANPGQLMSDGRSNGRRIAQRANNSLARRLSSPRTSLGRPLIAAPAIHINGGSRPVCGRRNGNVRDGVKVCVS